MTNPNRYPVISEDTVRVWRSAGIAMRLTRVKGGYIVQLR